MFFVFIFTKEGTKVSMGIVGQQKSHILRINGFIF